MFNNLKKKRLISNEWWSTARIKEALKKLGWESGELKGVAQDLLKLAQFKFIEAKGIGLWEHHKEYRGKNNG